MRHLADSNWLETHTEKGGWLEEQKDYKRMGVIVGVLVVPLFWFLARPHPDLLPVEKEQLLNGSIYRQVGRLRQSRVFSRPVNGGIFGLFVVRLFYIFMRARTVLVAW